MPKPSPSNAWPSKMTELAIKLFDEGMTASQAAQRIAEAFGAHITRNSVIGKWSRLGLTRMEKRSRDTVPVRYRPTLFKPTRAARNGKTRLSDSVAGLRDLALQMAAFVEPQPAVPVDLPPLRLSLEDLTESMCRYIVTEDSPFLYCAHEKRPGSSYCGFHHARCFTRASEYMPKKPLFEKQKRIAA